MRDRDSSLTRVEPVFSALAHHDATGVSWLPQLLKLPELGNAPNGAHAVDTISELEDLAWGNNERALAPPHVLLQWLICCCSPQASMVKTCDATRQKREALLRRDSQIIGEALALLARPSLPAKAWYILEGHSKPDVYLQTAEVIIVIEVKRTESGPTLSTDWMPSRPQILRHLDCAWEIRGSRRVFGFFIVEGSGGADAVRVPEAWVEVGTTTINPTSLRTGLPHRMAEERAEIERGFLGVTTWQRVCSEFGINWASLPDRLTLAERA